MAYLLSVILFVYCFKTAVLTNRDIQCQEADTRGTTGPPNDLGSISSVAQQAMEMAMVEVSLNDHIRNYVIRHRTKVTEIAQHTVGYDLDTHLALSNTYLCTVETAEECVIELSCDECLPEHMPLVTSHVSRHGLVSARGGDELRLSCGGGRFLAFPQRGALVAVCERGFYRAPGHKARPLLHFGCQESVFEDVLHPVEHCGAPLQGRAYQVQEEGGGVRHLATLCFDAERGVATRARAAAGALRLAPHAEARGPLSLLGNFNHMFDASARRAAERAFADDARATRRLLRLLQHHQVSFAGLSLTSAMLLAPEYFDEQYSRAARLVSNMVPSWSSVVRGNWRHLQRDVAALMSRARHTDLEVYAGTHGVGSVRAGDGREEIFLREGGRLPAPKYLWTVVLHHGSNRGLALVLLNDPFVTVSDIQEAVFCASACGRAAWLRELRRRRHYETPALGLVFCCEVHDFTNTVPEMPKELVKHIERGDDGMLFDFIN